MTQSNIPALQSMQVPDAWQGLPMAGTLAPAGEVAEKLEAYIGIPLRFTDVMFRESSYATKENPERDYAVCVVDTADGVIHTITCGGTVIVRQLREITARYPDGSFQSFVGIPQKRKNKLGEYYYLD